MDGIEANTEHSFPLSPHDVTKASLIPFLIADCNPAFEFSNEFVIFGAKPIQLIAPPAKIIFFPVSNDN